jgi:hypothetical protein
MPKTTPRNRSTRAPRQTDAAADMHAAGSNGSAAASASMSSHPTPSYDEIAEAAYQRYLSRGGHDGQDFDDWVEAERELKARHQ